MDSIKDKSAIIGIGETEYSKDSGRSELALAVDASARAIEDAGLKPQDIDGILRFAVDTSSEDEVMACLGIRDLTFYGELGYAGSAGAGLVTHAVSAIASGMATNVLLYRAMNGRSGRRYGAGAVTGRGGVGTTAFTEPYGLSGAGPAGSYVHPAPNARIRDNQQAVREPWRWHSGSTQI